jgi:TRAP-type C4-dicarboxylate transport system substrate-binding protein
MRRGNRNSISWILLTAALALSAIAVCSHAAAPKRSKRIIRLGTLAKEQTSMYKILLEMRDRWREAPDGGAELIVYAGTVGTEIDIVTRMRHGSLQAAMLTASGLSEIEEDLDALQAMPLIFRSYEEVEYIRERLRPELEEKLEAKGFIVIAWGDAGWVHLFSRHEARFPDDFRNEKIYTGRGNYEQIQLMKEAGFDPVPLEWSDVLTGMQTGMIDVVPTIPLYALAGQYFTRMKYMLGVNWVPLPGAVVITRKAWESLTPGVQQVMLETGREAALKMTARAREDNRKAVLTMQEKHGLKVQAVTPEMEKKWQDLAKTLYPSIRGRLVPEAMFDRVIRLLEEYRTAHQNSKP